MIKSDQLDDIQKLLQDDNLKAGIDGLENYLLTYPDPYSADQLHQIMADYKLMKDYWRRGFDDPQRADVYKRLIRQTYQLTTNIGIHHRIRNTASLNAIYVQARSHRKDWSVSMLRQDLENFVSNVAMLELEPEQRRAERRQQLYSEHYTMMKDLFDYIVTSRLWSDGRADAFRTILLSPTIDSNDQQLIVSAVTLSLTQAFDLDKLLLLMDVYEQSQDEAVRQRALVGWAFGLNSDLHKFYPEQQEAVDRLMANERTRQEIVELQQQLVYCLKTEDDIRVMNNEILPDLMKGNHLRVTENGVEEVNEDPLEDALHPEESERRMEQVEAAVRRMADMQKKGSDIYFGGFAQMKRFPFFYDMCNWLMPFYEEHPGVSHVWQKAKAARMLRMLLKTGPFCDSDKYSLALAFDHVMDKIPANIVEMMERGEARMAEVELNDEDRSRPEYMRRIYLQTLYRFFRLLPQRSDFRNPFDDEKDRCFVCKEQMINARMDAERKKLGRFLNRHKMYHEAQLVLSQCLMTDDKNSQEVLLMCAEAQLYTGALQAAESSLERLLDMEPDNERALVLLAKCETRRGLMGKAADTYKRLHELYGDKSKYLLNWAICSIQAEQFDEVVEPLYQLNYNSPDDRRVMHILAWALVGSGKLEQADKMYAKLLGTDNTEPLDWLNYGYCLWLKGDVVSAAGMFKEYADSQKGVFDAVDEFFYNGNNLLRKNGIGDVEIWLMIDLVS